MWNILSIPEENIGSSVFKQVHKSVAYMLISKRLYTTRKRKMIVLGLCKSRFLTIYIVYSFLCLQDCLENNKMQW